MVFPHIWVLWRRLGWVYEASHYKTEWIDLGCWGSSQGYNFLNASPTENCVTPSWEARGGFSPVRAWFWHIFIGWAHHYFYLGDPKPRSQFKMRGLLQADRATMGHGERHGFKHRYLFIAKICFCQLWSWKPRAIKPLISYLLCFRSLFSWL